MSWIREHKLYWRAALLLFLTAAFMGPWTISSDGVPPPEWCDSPNLLLEDNRCVRLVYGTEIITFYGTVVLAMIVWLGSGAADFLSRVSEFIFTIGLFLLILPTFSTLLLIWGRETRGRRSLHMMALGLAAASALPLALSAPSLSPIRLWGIWLFIGLAAGALLLELLTPCLHEKARR
jgi:hypothetical protein